MDRLKRFLPVEPLLMQEPRATPDQIRVDLGRGPLLAPVREIGRIAGRVELFDPVHESLGSDQETADLRSDFGLRERPRGP